MTLTRQALDSFLAAFERNANGSNAAASAAQFAEHFLAGGPDGVRVVPAAAFAMALPKRKENFQQAGLRSSRMIARKDTPIGERFILVDTAWRMGFALPGKPESSIDAGSAFLIDLGAAEPKIVAYLTHQDIFKQMRERGLLEQSA